LSGNSRPTPGANPLLGSQCQALEGSRGIPPDGIWRTLGGFTQDFLSSVLLAPGNGRLPPSATFVNVAS